MAPAKKRQKLVNGDAAVTASVDDNRDGQNSTNKAQEGAEQQRRSLFVRSLDPSTTTETLTGLFSEWYPVKHAIAVIDPATKQCRGYGFVTFADAEDAQRAKDEFNGHMLGGRKLRIEVAEPRHRDSAGGKSEEVQAHREKQQDVPQPSRLIVRNLPWSIKTSDQLSKLFMSYGKIKHAYIPQKASGLMAGFGFVVMRGRKNAEKAMEGINGKEVDGRTLAVDWAVSKDTYEDLVKSQPRNGLKDGEDVTLAKQARQANGDGASNDSGSGTDEDDGDDAEESGDQSDDEEIEVKVDGEGSSTMDRSKDRSSTLFVRNLPFTCTDEDLEDHFSSFGSTRYARVVLDSGTERSKGTGFVCFYNKTDADACLRDAPRRTLPSTTTDNKDVKGRQTTNTLLQDEAADPSGQYTMDGRVLQISRAVDKSEANRLTEESSALRRKRNEDKRRLYLLSEGTISSNSKLWEKLSPSERTMREASAKQRKSLVESNPSLHLSLTRLSIRNVPRSVDSKELKALARDAVVGFAKDVKEGTRQKISKEELTRGGEEMLAAEAARKTAGKGVVKQAKMVFEGAGGSKVSEDSGAGRSRGYGFIEYHTHRNALMGLRWLNGHAVGYQVTDQTKGKTNREEVQDRKKRLIVEFAIENVQVVMRRKDREEKARDRAGSRQDAAIEGKPDENSTVNAQSRTSDSRKRKEDR